MARTTGSLKLLMDELVLLEQTFATEAGGGVRVYRWVPAQFQAPGIFNWMDPSAFSVKSISEWRDTINIRAIIGIRHTDADADMSKMEEMADTFRTVVDDALHVHRPLNGVVTSAARTSMLMGSRELSGIPFLTIEFPLTFQLDRKISPYND